MSLTEEAPAKLNLALHVRRRRPDGYHELDTIFAFTRFGDTLTAAPADNLSLTLEGAFATVVDATDNLVLRAATALRDAAGTNAGAALHLVKRIPVAAGLGGGSADAAATLRLLNRQWGLDWPVARLADLGASLGADVPACVIGGILRGTGRGERLVPLAMPGLSGTAALLVNPRVAVPTGPVFAAWDGVDHGAIAPDASLEAMRNDLEAPALGLAPVVAECLAALSETDATLVRMSGSGATCFALYADHHACRAAADQVAGRAPGWWLATTSVI